jgi:biotin operon repressor
MSVPTIGEPFNPGKGSCGFWPEDIVDRQRDLGDGPKRTYRRLRSYAGKNGSCFPSQQTLAGDLGKSERQVRRDLDELEAAGLIGSKSRDGRRSNTYLFLWHAMFEQTHTSGQASDLSGHSCPINKASVSQPEPNVSARGRTDMTGVTGHGCPPNSFSELFQRKEKQQAAARAPHADIPRKPPGDPGPKGDHQSVCPSIPAEETVEGFSEMQTLLAKHHVRFRPGQIQELIEAGRAQGLTVEGVLAFVEDKLVQKRDQNDPVFSAKLLINAISDDTDLHRWGVKRHRCSSFFNQPRNRSEPPFTVAELRAHLSDRAETLRTISGCQEIAAELDLLATDSESHLHDLESLEQRLTTFEDRIVAVALAQMAEADLRQMRGEVASKLEPYRRKMTTQQSGMLERQYREQWLFESNGIPRLSLFYLDIARVAA